MNDTVTEPTTPAGAGALLREAREAAGAHIAALAVALKVPVRQLEALEADRLDQLPDATFARALAASVCRQLRIDPQPILDHMPQAGPRAMKVPEDLQAYRGPAAAGVPLRDRLGRPAVWAAAALLVAALLLLALPALQSLLGGSGQGAAPAPAPAPVAAPVPGDAAAPASGAAPGTVIENVNPVLVPSVPASAGSPSPAAVPAASSRP